MEDNVHDQSIVSKTTTTTNHLPTPPLNLQLSTSDYSLTPPSLTLKSMTNHLSPPASTLSPQHFFQTTPPFQPYNSYTAMLPPPQAQVTIEEHNSLKLKVNLLESKLKEACCNVDTMRACMGKLVSSLEEKEVDESEKDQEDDIDKKTLCELSKKSANASEAVRRLAEIVFSKEELDTCTVFGRNTKKLENPRPALPQSKRLKLIKYVTKYWKAVKDVDVTTILRDYMKNRIKTHSR